MSDNFSPAELLALFGRDRAVARKARAAETMLGTGWSCAPARPQVAMKDSASNAAIRITVLLVRVNLPYS